MNKIAQLVKDCRGSSFNLYSEESTVNFHTFPKNIALYTDSDIYEDISMKSINDKTIDKLLSNATPKFQRANDKWSLEMQTKFIENLLKGAKTQILLFKFKENADSKIIDGLQRTTAIMDFFKDKIKPFGYSRKELGEYVSHFNTRVSVREYIFDDWESVANFYIDMNEHITHSKEDIQKAKDYFLAEHGIKL